MIKNTFIRNTCCALVLTLGFATTSMVDAAEFSASFKGTDINEFISTVGKNLNKNFSAP